MKASSRARVHVVTLKSMVKPYSASAGAPADDAAEHDDDRGRSPARDVKGRWVAGNSGNPAGRPKTLAELVELARDHTVEAFETMVWIARHEPKAAVRGRAAEWIVARGWGEPAKPITVGATDGDNKLELQFVLMPPKPDEEP